MGVDSILSEPVASGSQSPAVSPDQGPPPYHIFECKGERFVYDTSSCRFFRIDGLTYDFLDLCHTHSIEEAKAVLLKRNGHSVEEIQSVASEVAIMAENGLFDVPDYSISDEEVERQLQQRYDAPWNKLELALAETCNLACTYCYCRTCRDMPNQGLMSESVARQAITWLFAMSGRSKDVSITFFGGEPLLNKPVLRFAIEYSQRLAKLHGKKMHYSMTTNGTLLDDEVIGYIKKYNFGLMVSLDGPQEIHDAQCPTHDGKGSFEMAAAGIKKLMERRKRVTVRCTLTHNGPKKIELVQFFESFGFTRIVISAATNFSNPSPVDFMATDFESLEEQDRTDILSWFLDKIHNGSIPVYNPYLGFLNAQSKKHTLTNWCLFRCGACHGTMTVTF